MGKLEIIAHSTLLLATIVFVVFTVFVGWGDSDLDTTAGTRKIGEVRDSCKKEPKPDKRAKFLGAIAYFPGKCWATTHTCVY